MSVTRTSDRATTQATEPGPNIRWDDSTMRSAYANVCNVTGTREEVVLLFGVNQTWKDVTKEVVIQLLDRIILSPFAAKRLNMLLSRALKEYEGRYGHLSIEPGDTSRPAEPLTTS